MSRKRRRVNGPRSIPIWFPIGVFRFIIQFADDPTALTMRLVCRNWNMVFGSMHLHERPLYENVRLAKITVLYYQEIPLSRLNITNVADFTRPSHSRTYRGKCVTEALKRLLEAHSVGSGMFKNLICSPSLHKYTFCEKVYPGVTFSYKNHADVVLWLPNHPPDVYGVPVGNEQVSIRPPRSIDNPVIYRNDLDAFCYWYLLNCGQVFDKTKFNLLLKLLGQYFLIY